MRGHIGVVSIDVLEDQLFMRDDFLDAVKKNITTGRYNDNWFLIGKMKEDYKEPDHVQQNISIINREAEKVINKVVFR